MSKKISQHNHLTFARYDLTAIEKDIIYVIISKLKRDDTKSTKYVITVSELETTRNDKINHTRLIDTCSNLLGKNVKVKNSAKKWRGINVFESIDYDEGKMTFILTDSIRPLLFNLSKNFTKYDLKEALSLKSKYSKRLYEILCSWRNKGEYEITLDQMREYFHLENKFPEWQNIKQRIIVPSLNEISSKTTLQVKARAVKKGRAVEKIQFLIK